MYNRENQHMNEQDKKTMSKINEYFFESLPSTNTYAKENISSLKLPALIIANGQTDGRGRRGNSFYSPANTGLYMTAIFPAPSNCGLLTPVAAVAVCKELEKLGIEPKIKWVNDVFVDSFKVCGILTELFSSGQEKFIALGIGINLTTEIFPKELTNAGSVGINCDKTKLAREITNSILQYCKNSNDLSVIEEYKKRLFILGKEITYCKNNIEYSAKVLDINEHCNLVVLRDNGSKDILSSGEISIKI